MSDNKLRIIYACATITLIVVEVLIALFVHDKFVRPYVGDVLVVIALYTFVRIFIPRKVFLLPVYIFVFAAGVEVLQLFHIVEILGVENNTFMRTLIGSVFDLKDVICYLIGCTILQLLELIKVEKND